MSFDAKITKIVRNLLYRQVNPKSPYAISKQLGKHGGWLAYRLEHKCGFGIIALRDLIAVLNADKGNKDKTKRKKDIWQLFNLGNVRRIKMGRFEDALPTDVVMRTIFTGNLKNKCRQAEINYRQMQYFMTHTDIVDIPARHIAALLDVVELSNRQKEIFHDWLFSTNYEGYLIRDDDHQNRANSLDNTDFQQ